jgi:hypothetical protein
MVIYSVTIHSGNFRFVRERVTAPKSAFPFRGRWLSVKTLAFLPKDGRGRSL